MKFDQNLLVCVISDYITWYYIPHTTYFILHNYTQISSSSAMLIGLSNQAHLVQWEFNGLFDKI